MTFEEAVACASRCEGGELTPNEEGGGTVAASNALEAATWWYVPCRCIGSHGFMVEKATGEVHLLGSAVPIHLCFWAQDRGLVRHPCDLIVDASPDTSKSLDLLESVLDFPGTGHVPRRRYSRESIAKKLAALPARFPHQSLWFSIEALHAAHVSGAMECHGEADSGEVWRQDVLRVVLDSSAILELSESDEACAALQRAIDTGGADVVAAEGTRSSAVYLDMPSKLFLRRQPDKKQLLRDWNVVRRKRGRVPRRLVEGRDAPHESAEVELLQWALGQSGARLLASARPGELRERIPPAIEVISVAELLDRVDRPLDGLTSPPEETH